MPRQFYSEIERLKILNIVTNARKGGHKWSDIHQFAQRSGFRGGLPALKVYFSKAMKKKFKQPKSRIHPGVAVAVSATKFSRIER